MRPQAHGEPPLAAPPVLDVVVGSAGKRRTPCQAQPTRRSGAPDRASRVGDPPLSDRPALAFVSFSSTARRSRGSGGRFPFGADHPPRLPGAAEPTWPTGSARSPVRSSPACRRRRPSCLVLRSPTAASSRRPGRPGRLGSAAVVASAPGTPDPIRRLADHPRSGPLGLVNPVGPRHSRWPRPGLPLPSPRSCSGRSSGSGRRVLPGARPTLHRASSQVKSLFRDHRVIHHISR